MEALNFANCFKLDQKPLIAAMHLKIKYGEKFRRDRIQMILPGSEIPEWFGDKGIGSSLTIQLPSNCHQLKGIAFCLVFLLPLPSHDMLYAAKYLRINLDSHVKSKNGDGDSDDDEVFFSKHTHTKYKFLKTCDFDHMFQHYEFYSGSNFLKTCVSDHMFLHYELGFIDHFRKYSGNEVTFKFYNEMDNGKMKKCHDIQNPCKFKSCGVYLHFDENLQDNTLFVKNIPTNKRLEEN
ncbi:hypothetical protein OIU85_003103 [Salix viminalis]|uniref:C-JID domain-containing protein n=1 Tax=Salix viminalis TaxID=40686 RepID=A0A9Q0PYI0_SALVM|nr:hypothetical protein OIU85_003103 [Salix viminalis]